MSLSLRDQMLKAGLVNEKQVKQATKDQKRQHRLEKKGAVEVDETQRQAALKAMAEKQQRDQALNREQQEEQQALLRAWIDYAQQYARYQSLLQRVQDRAGETLRWKLLEAQA